MGPAIPGSARSRRVRLGRRRGRRPYKIEGPPAQGLEPAETTCNQMSGQGNFAAKRHENIPRGPRCAWRYSASDHLRLALHFRAFLWPLDWMASGSNHFGLDKRGGGTAPPGYGFPFHGARVPSPAKADPNRPPSDRYSVSECAVRAPRLQGGGRGSIASGFALNPASANPLRPLRLAASLDGLRVRPIG